MNKQQAQQIIRDTFESSFDKNGFTGFIKNLLNRIDDAPFTYQGNYIPDAYKQYIKKLERIGKFSDGENSIDILVITLQKKTSLERARTMQRNFIAWYLNGSRGGEMKDAALAAFVSPGEEDWRFSLVKMDYKFEKTKTGRMKVKEEFTPARRWSFLVGANEKSHTAQSRLVNILANDEQAPTLEEIGKSFDIETVTKEFFLKYRELFLRTKEELDKVVIQASSLRKDFEAKGVDTVNFAKKLLGQIIFLYFLQKKGWFGVGRDDDWGTGSKHFLRKLFEKKHSDYNNFYNDILEPLFYEALRIDRSHVDGYYSRFDCKIPFLNGGLFDPIGNYDWVHTDIIIPDKLFSNNVKTKEGDIGSGILDVFDRYNFTVKEDEPLEKEVAIDPELLGKSYEKFNAIRPDNYDEFRKALKSGKKGDENKFNKKFGVYYTPREIVHYMCQQSLINYLHSVTQASSLSNNNIASSLSNNIVTQASSLSISKEDIETLIHTGEQFSEIEARVISEGSETRTYSHKLPESIRKNAALIDQKLDDITVCDPAVGSGAFPVGMMNEIVRARNVLSTFIHRQDACATTYDFKRRCIEHSLYGVDIDPGAVEIAKLRLWLSLMVDEEDIKNIKPLPNLDYKIVCGNSLLGVEKNLFNNELFNELEKLKPLFFNETNPTKKQEYKKQIDKLISEITNGHTEFDFEVYFSEVFHQKGVPVRQSDSGCGFDVVIANPPYGADLSKKEKTHLDVKFLKYKSNVKNSAIYFIYVSSEILNGKGINSFIVPKSLCYSAGWNKCASVVRQGLNKLIDTGKAFEEVKLEQVIFVRVHENSCSDYVNGIYDGYKLKEFAKVNKDIFEDHNVLLTGQTLEEMKLISKILNNCSSKWSDYVSIERGLNWQSKVIKGQGSIPIYRGAQLSPYFLDNPTDFIDVNRFNKNEYNYQFNPKILNQLAIAHVQNPYPHFYLQAALDVENKIVFETISCTFVKNDLLSIKFLLAINNSKLFAWLLYKFVYSNAIRSTRYDEQYVGKVPCPHFNKTNQELFIQIVDRILAITKDDDYLQNSQKQTKVKTLEREIDQMVYKLYGLTNKEIKIVENI